MHVAKLLAGLRTLSFHSAFAKSSGQPYEEKTCEHANLQSNSSFKSRSWQICGSTGERVSSTVNCACFARSLTVLDLIPAVRCWTISQMDRTSLAEALHWSSKPCLVIWKNTHREHASFKSAVATLSSCSPINDTSYKIRLLQSERRAINFTPLDTVILIKVQHRNRRKRPQQLHICYCQRPWVCGDQYRVYVTSVQT